MTTELSTDYKLIRSQLRAITDGEPDHLANSANFIALLNSAIPTINWVGIYVLRDDELLLGPFQGNTACVRIPLEKGVCGTAAATRTTQRVDDVHDFPGHIACDAASRSEIVVPLSCEGTLIGVLDMDSPIQARFDEEDQVGVESLCRMFEKIVCSNGAAESFI